jgi:hypothetical protein
MQNNKNTNPDNPSRKDFMEIKSTKYSCSSFSIDLPKYYQQNSSGGNNSKSASDDQSQSQAFDDTHGKFLYH